MEKREEVDKEDDFHLRAPQVEIEKDESDM